MGGLGYAPIASGTVGTVPAVVLWYFVAPQVAWWVWVGVAAGFTLVSFGAAARGGALWGEPDSGKIVIDEVAGAAWTFVLVPHGWAWALGGFLAFRFFDIVKVWPSSYFDTKVKTGVGVTMDDVVAGWYACAVLHLARWLLSA